MMPTAVTVEAKRCTACGEHKPLTEYHRNRTHKDGRQSRCKPCQIAAVKAGAMAYSAALSALRNAHPSEFEALLARERQARGLTTTAGAEQ